MIFTFILIIVPLTAGMLIFIQTQNRNNITSKFLDIKTHIEGEMINSIQMVDSGLKIYEKEVEKSMENILYSFLDAYNLSGNNINLVNLSNLKVLYENRFDFYVINSSMEIINSTYIPDIGLDFSDYPEYNEYLTDILNGNEIKFDRVIYETLTGIVRKYGYIPTPDHQFILEIGLNSAELANLVIKFNFLNKAEELSSLDPVISEIRIFDVVGHWIGHENESLTESYRTYIVELFRAKSNIEILNNTTNILTKCTYVDLYDSNYSAQPSKLIEFTYNLNILEQEIRSGIVELLIFGFLILIIVIALIIFMSNQITKPLNSIFNDLNSIKQGKQENIKKIRSKTELKELEISLNSLLDRLKEYERIQIRNQKIEMIERFSNGIAHDYNNLLLAIMGNIELLKFEPLSKEQEDICDDLILAAKRAQDITDQLLFFSKHGEPNKKMVNLESLIKESVSLVLYQSKCEFNLENFIPDLIINVDPGQINQVLNNLLLNAVQAMPLGGKIFMTIRIVNSLSETIKNATEKDYIEIIVSDTGSGIPLEIQKDIFTPYFTTKPNGHGLGLMNSFRIIKNHEGFITFDSQEGKGTCFYIYLPLE